MIQLLQTGMPPSNLSFLIATYIVAGLAFLGYAYYIFRRRQDARSEIRRLTNVSRENESVGRESP